MALPSKLFFVSTSTLLAVSGRTHSNALPTGRRLSGAVAAVRTLAHFLTIHSLTLDRAPSFNIRITDPVDVALYNVVLAALALTGC